jgi:deazaflavin-dependent oxidoreductase (nitroreductase family)
MEGMMDFNSLPKSVLRTIRRPPQIVYALGLGWAFGRLVLLLTTTGRRTGLARVTPLQYEEVGGVIYLASARGLEADWVKNIQANPRVQIRVKERRFDGLAEVCTDPERIADFLEMRLQRHPRMIGAMFQAEGLKPGFSREELLAYVRRLALVIVRPLPATSIE